MKKLLLAILLLSLFGCNAPTQSRRIAHAGGGYKGEDYTSSFEALDANLARGFTLFEIDLNWSVDNQLVCIHDWEENYLRFFGAPMKKRPTLEEFVMLVKTRSPYHLCTLTELSKWLVDNPKARIVTDVKDDNLKALKIISKIVMGFEERIIPQVYQPESFRKVRELGYKDVIWTLYKYDGTSDDVISRVKEMEGIFAVTMPKERVIQGLGKRVKEAGVFTYTHTVNNQADLDLSRRAGIDDVYTDRLPAN